jgi:hypothetical protein
VALRGIEKPVRFSTRFRTTDVDPSNAPRVVFCALLTKPKHAETVAQLMRRILMEYARALAGATIVVLSLAIGTAVALQQARRAERRFQEVRKLANTFLFDIHDRTDYSVT